MKFILSIAVLYGGIQVMIAQNTRPAHTDLLEQTQFFEDKTRQMPVALVVRQVFGPMPRRNWMENSHTNAAARYWLRFQIDNTSARDTLRRLFFTGMHGRTELFEQKDTGFVKLAEGGIYAHKAAAEGQINAYCLPLSIPPGGRSTYLVAVHNYYKMYDHLRAESFAPEAYRFYCQAYKEKQLPYLLFLGCIIGGLAILSVFGLMQYLFTRGMAYIWYALFAFANCLNFIRVLEMTADSGYISDWIPFFITYFMITPAATTFLYLKFTWHFLDFQSKNNIYSKWFGRLVTFFGGVLLFTTCVALANYVQPDLASITIFWFRLMHLLIYILGVLILVLVVKARGILNRFIAAGTFLLLVGGILSTAMEWGSVQAPLHETLFPYDPKMPLGVFSLLESLCLALGLGYKTKMLEIEKREAVLEQEHQRQRISRDLHDEIGSTLSSISILSEAALRNLQADIDRARFGAIGERARQVMEAMSDIVWSVNPQNDTMANVLQRMKEFAVELFEPQGIALHFDAGEAVKTLNLPMEQRKDFYLLFKEAVNNAAKYSGAADVWVTVRAENGGLLLEVRDNGRGFDPEAVKRGNGLWNMQRRAERMGGTFEMASAVGSGTTIRITV